MKLGLNLSFGIKRWTEPEILADMCAKDFAVKNIQFSWDYIDPWWPEEQRDTLARDFGNKFRAAGLSIDSSFGGNAAYVFSHFLAASKIQRDLALEYFKRAGDEALALGTTVIGSPAGHLTYREARDPKVRQERYKEMLDYYHKLAEYGKKTGLTEIQIEATPLWTEFPHDPDNTISLFNDLKGTDIPVTILVDWGHALFKPLLKEKADIELWFMKCKDVIGGLHLQQTDGAWDRHWDFTNEDGIVTPELIKRATENAGLGDIVQFLEVVPIYEDDDDAVYDRMKKTMDYLHKELGV